MSGDVMVWACVIVQRDQIIKGRIRPTRPDLPAQGEAVVIIDYGDPLWSSIKAAYFLSCEKPPGWTVERWHEAGRSILDDVDRLAVHRQHSRALARLAARRRR